VPTCPTLTTIWFHYHICYYTIWFHYHICYYYMVPLPYLLLLYGSITIFATTIRFHYHICYYTIWVYLLLLYSSSTKFVTTIWLHYHIYYYYMFTELCTIICTPYGFRTEGIESLPQIQIFLYLDFSNLMVYRVIL